MLHPSIEIKNKSINNKGLFAKTTIKKGEVLWKLNQSEKQLTKTERDNLPKDEQNIAFQYFDKYIVVHDGSQFMNHSCDPNTWWTADDELSASQDINIGDEITYDYSTADIGNWTASWQCNCDSIDCRKIISGKDILNKELSNKYSGHLPTWVKDYIKNNI